MLADGHGAEPRVLTPAAGRRQHALKAQTLGAAGDIHQIIERRGAELPADAADVLRVIARANDPPAVAVGR